MLASMPALAQQTVFTPGNLVVAVEGCGVRGGTCTSVPNGSGANGSYGDNQAAPLTLFQYTPNGTASVAYQNSLVLPQNASGANLPVSGEYGSSSEATLQLSGGGQYLTIVGYGINAATFDANPDAYGAAPSGALAQSGSLTGQSYTPIPRVLTLIDANGNVNSSTAIYNIFNNNNPRSAYTLDGLNAWVSGQGNKDDTGGVFYVPIGMVTTAPVAITGLDTSSNSEAQDTRIVQVYNNTLYVSVDSKEGSGSNRDFIGTLGAPPATSLYNGSAGPTQLSGFGTTKAGKLTITSGANGNGNGLNAGQQINLSPVGYFFASPSVLYVADGGDPKNDSNGDTNSTGTANIGDGGLQKWVNSKTDGTGTWTLAYTLYQGLNLVNNGNTDGTSGLYGLAATVSGNNVLVYATNYTLNDLDPTYLYGITDNLTYTKASQAAGESFTPLATAPADSNFKGVSFAPAIPAGDVEITTLPSGLAFTASGAGCEPGAYTTPVTLTWTPGNSCTLSVVTPQTSPAGIPYMLVGWQNGTASSSQTVIAPATTATYTAAFVGDFSGAVKVTSSGLVHSRATGAYSGTVTITNTSSSPVPAPVQSVFTNLIAGATLTNATGTYQGSPSITVSANAPLAAGASISFPVTFSYGGTAAISYISKTLSGTF